MTDINIAADEVSDREYIDSVFKPTLRQRAALSWSGLDRRVKMYGTAAIASVFLAAVAYSTLGSSSDVASANAVVQTRFDSTGTNADYEANHAVWRAKALEMFKQLHNADVMLQEQVTAIGKAQKIDPKVIEKIQKDIDNLKALIDSGNAKVSEIEQKQQSLAARIASALNPIGSANAAAAPAEPAQQVAEKKHSDRFLWAMQQCSKLAAQSERDQWLLDGKYAKYSDEQLKTAIEDCKNPNRYRDAYYQRAVRQSQENYAPAADATIAPPAPASQEVDDEQPVQVAQAVIMPPPVRYAPPPVAYGTYGAYGTRYYQQYQYQSVSRRPVTRMIETVPPELRSTSYRCNPDGSPATPGTGWCHRR